MGRPDIWRAAAIIVLIGVFIATLAAINRHPGAPSAPDAPSVSASDDLSTELRRCSALGPQDAEDPRCRAVWEENRHRFFGSPARPLAPVAAPAIPLTQPTNGGSRSITSSPPIQEGGAR